jgi:hypothetical protein
MVYQILCNSRANFRVLSRVADRDGFERLPAIYIPLTGSENWLIFATGFDQLKLHFWTFLVLVRLRIGSNSFWVQLHDTALNFNPAISFFIP